MEKPVFGAIFAGVLIAFSLFFKNGWFIRFAILVWIGVIVWRRGRQLRHDPSVPRVAARCSRCNGVIPAGTGLTSGLCDACWQFRDGGAAALPQDPGSTSPDS